MATQMLKHTITSSWAKIVSGATGVALQGFPETYLVHIGNDVPAPGSGGKMSTLNEESFVRSGLSAADDWSELAIR